MKTPRWYIIGNYEFLESLFDRTRMSISDVFGENDNWFFLDDTWKQAFGPFSSLESVITEYEKYCGDIPVVENGSCPMKLNEICKESHQISKDHGWHDSERTFGDFIALCHSELSEALEYFRKTGNTTETIYETDNGKPEGVPSELADVIIRIADYCGQMNIDLEEIVRVKMDYNKSRSYRHGNKVI